MAISWGSNNYIWQTTTATSSISTWPSPTLSVASPPPAPVKKCSLLDWLADEVDSVCALTREPVPA